MNQMVPAFVQGVLTPVEKLEVHRRGLRHLAISVFVMRGTEVLLQRRALTKYHTPGLWTNTCCTHPYWGEDPVACAQRRLREELGMTGVLPVLRDKVEYRAEVGGGLTEHEVVDILLADVTPQMTLAPNPDEVAEIRWIDLYDLDAELRRWPDRFTPWLQIYMAEYREQIFGVWAGVRANCSETAAARRRSLPLLLPAQDGRAPPSPPPRPAASGQRHRG